MEEDGGRLVPTGVSGCGQRTGLCRSSGGVWAVVGGMGWQGGGTGRKSVGGVVGGG